MDHREGIRRRALALVKIQYGNGFNYNCGSGLMYDISPDGMFVLSELVPNVNDSVEIWMSLSIEENTPVRIPAMVVHCSKNGFGLMFRELDNEVRVYLSEILSRYQAWK